MPYCHAKKHNSVIYMINKESHRFIKEIILPGQPHVGGLAYDSEHQILWYSSNTQELAQAVVLPWNPLKIMTMMRAGILSRPTR